MSEEQAFRSQHGHPFRNDVADCVAIASSTPPRFPMPHRSFLQAADAPFGGQAAGSSVVDSQYPEIAMRHSYSGSVLPTPASGAAAMMSVPVGASASSLSSVRQDRPTSSSRQSLTESKWKWLHSNAMMPEQPSAISLRRAGELELDIPSQSSASPSHRSASNTTAAPAGQNLTDRRLVTKDSQDSARSTRTYHSKQVVDSGVAEQPQSRKTTVDLIQSVSDAHRSVDDKSIRHWRHSSDNTAQRPTADVSSRMRDNYGLTLSLSGAAVGLGSEVKKLDADHSTNGHATRSSGDLPQKLPIERIIRFERPDVAEGIVWPPLRSAFKDVASRTGQHEPESVSIRHSASPPLAAASGRSGRLSIPDTIPIYFRAEPSETQAQHRSSRVETKAGRNESETVLNTTSGHQQPSYIANSHSSASFGMYVLALVSVNTVRVKKID